MSKKMLRAVGYCRTSGEGQRDNTSIGNQRHTIKEYCERNGWTLDRLYVDECKTGSKIAGREAFQEMLRDAATGKFDVVVVLDIDRLARDGTDIVSTAKTLKMAFKIDTVDTKGKYDTRDRNRRFANWVMAGVADDERLRIMERTVSGRMRRAAEGKPWSGKTAWPVGRAWDEEKGRWYITDEGRAIAAMLKRYLAGEGTTELGKEMGKRASKICAWIRYGQLGGEYKARFHCPELDIDKEIPVPGMPEVVPAKVIEKAKARLAFNRTNNRTDVQKYVLTGFLRCGVCGKALTGRDPHHAKRTYYHARANAGPDCGIRTVPGEDLEAVILDYLYAAFLDRPAFDKAVEAAGPSLKDRQALDKEREELVKRIAVNQTQTSRLADAVAKGMDLSLLLHKQESLKADRDSLAVRLADLEARLATLPDPELTKLEAKLTRLRLSQQYKGRDWRKLSFDDVRQFLLHLFGETTISNGNGVFVWKDSHGVLVVKFRGQVDFQDLLANGRPLTKSLYKAMEKWAAYHAKRGVNLEPANLSARYTQVRVTLKVCSSQPAA